MQLETVQQTMRNYEFPPEIKEWIDIVEKGTYRTSKWNKFLVKHVKHCFATEDIYIDEERLRNYMHLIDKYVPYEIFPWERFVIVLHDCVYWSDTKMPRWPDLFCEIGRGAGKDGMIAMESFCLSSQYNGIREYDVDICGNNEEQAVRPVTDLVGFFEEPKYIRLLKKFYHWTKEKIVSTKTRSTIKGRTNNPKGKDGLRSGIVIFNELHQYENYDNINVFTTGLGKKPDPRRSYYTTNGDVREGPLDDLEKDAFEILQEYENCDDPEVDDNGLLAFICKLDAPEEVDDEENWAKANPSIPYLPTLLVETRKEYREWKNSPERLPAFMSKRMNLQGNKKETAVADWEFIAKTNKPVPDLSGWSCTVGIDYAKTTDWVSVNLHFKDGEKRYDINHAWICSQSKDLHRIKAPWKKWCEDGLCTFVDDVEISPTIPAEYIKKAAEKYTIKMVALDTYRYALLSSALNEIGISKDNKNLKLVSQRDIIRVVPVIEHCFIKELLNWSDNPCLRWATNNTKLIRYGRSEGADKGSFVYAKIEGKSRKTDPFMAFVASVSCENELDGTTKAEVHNIPTIIF